MAASVIHPPFHRKFFHNWAPDILSLGVRRPFPNAFEFLAASKKLNMGVQIVSAYYLSSSFNKTIC